MNYDLHCHSTASDGTLSPAAMVERAVERGVDVLALTDHDTTAGIAEARIAAEANGLELRAGVEISVTWHGHTIHVLALNVDPDAAELAQGLAKIRETRDWRAEEMGRRLENQGIEGAYAEAQSLASGGLIARTHYGRLLIKRGLADSIGGAIKKYLRRGKPAFVGVEWASLEDMINWTTAAGGVAVIAHPARYKMTATKLRLLVEDFKQLGGKGLEVVSGSHNPTEVRMMADIVRRHGLYGSRGSDYHGPENRWIELGRMVALPDDCPPIWQCWH